MNNLFSNDYTFNTTTVKGGLAYRYSYKKISAGIGSDISGSKWKQENHFNDSTRKYSFNNFFPRANLSYKLGQTSRLGFDYKGNTTAPNINQLQPVANNNDPLNIAIGNPELKQSFKHEFNLNFSVYQVLKNRGINANISGGFVNNDFSTRDQIDTAGRRQYQTVNVNGNYYFAGWIGTNFKWRKPDIQFGVTLYPGFSSSKNFVNGRENISKSQYYSLGLYAGKNKDRKYEITINSQIVYSFSRSSINKNAITKYWTAQPNASIRLYLPLDIMFTTDINYNWRQKTEVFNQNNNTLIWNASIDKKLMKSHDLRIGIDVRDILNQNLGFNRNINSNYITERTYDVIKRYWMVTLNYNFNKGPKKEPELRF